ncbi:hypothetical protein BJY52DRAFT_1356835 [Lactarius psammicola]|nr:hypothetical protein BJY52DRAFT_1356835 [Lactarius psammicola]
MKLGSCSVILYLGVNVLTLSMRRGPVQELLQVDLGRTPRGTKRRSLDEQTTIVLRNGTIGRHKRHWPLQIDLVGFCGGHTRERTWQTFDRGELGIGLGSIAVQLVGIDFDLAVLDSRRDYTGIGVAKERRRSRRDSRSVQAAMMTKLKRKSVLLLLFTDDWAGTIRTGVLVDAAPHRERKTMSERFLQRTTCGGEHRNGAPDIMLLGEETGIHLNLDSLSEGNESLF